MIAIPRHLEPCGLARVETKVARGRMLNAARKHWSMDMRKLILTAAAVALTASSLLVDKE